MKKIISLLLCAIMIFLLVSCGEDKPDVSDNGKITVVTTLFPMYDFVREIAGDLVDVSILLSPGTESHSYEPTPSDIMKIMDSDLFICIGGVSELWVDEVLKANDSEDVNVLKLISCADGEPCAIAGEHDESEIEHLHTLQDEHIWTSPKIAMKMTQKICDALIEIDNENSATYRENTDTYIHMLNVLDEDFAKLVQENNSRSLIFADRFPFGYLAGAYGFKCEAAFSGCSDDTEPSAAVIKELIDLVKAENTPAIFKIEFSSGAIAETIAEETGVEILELHSCHTVSKDDLKNGITYIDLMRRNLENISSALK